LQLLLATAGGCGLLPWAPGSWGTLPAVAIYAGVACGVPTAWQWLALAALAVGFSGLSLLVSPWAVRYWGKKDPGRFVLDEVAGYLVAVAIFPGPWAFELVEFAATPLLLTCIWSYLAFRLFDAVKPPPVNWLERLSGGWGILADDLFAGVYAGGALHLLAVVAPHWYGVG